MQRNYLDRIGSECVWPNGLRAGCHNVAADGICTDCGASVAPDVRPGSRAVVTFVEVRDAVQALRPAWRVDEDYPDVVSVYPEYAQDPNGPVFVVGTANATWAADFYPSGDAQESGECYVGFDTDIDEETCTDADEVATEIVAEVERYMKRRPVRGEFLERLRAFHRAAYELDAAWGKLDAEDSSALVDYYPFQHSFDEMTSKIDEWVKQARGALNDECQEHPADYSYGREPIQKKKKS